MTFSLTKNQILEDVLFLHKTISENNPFKFLKERTHNITWDNCINQFSDWAKTVQTSEDYLRLIQRICAVSQCGHISICPDWLISLHNEKYFPDLSPWRTIGDDEHYYNSNLYWHEIAEKVEADNRETDIPSYRHILHDIELNSETLYMSLPMMRFPNEEITSHYKSIVDSLTKYQNFIIDIRGNPGGGDSAWIDILSMIICKDLITPLVFLYRNSSHVEPFCKSAFEDEPIEDIKNCPFDIYRSINESLLKKEFATPIFKYDVLRRNVDSINYSGNIAVIMNKDNFSSSEAFLVRVKHNKLATLIGETSGGDGVGSTPAIFVLPNSRLAVRYPVLLGLNPDGSINDEFPTSPDIYCTVKRFEKPLNLYEDNGKSWLLADNAVQTALYTFSRK